MCCIYVRFLWPGCSIHVSPFVYCLSLTLSLAVTVCMPPCGLVSVHMCMRFPLWHRWWRICLQCRRPGFGPCVRKIPWRKKQQPNSVFLPGKSHGQGSLAGYSPWGCKELDMTENYARMFIHVVCVCSWTQEWFFSNLNYLFKFLSWFDQFWVLLKILGDLVVSPKKHRTKVLMTWVVVLPLLLLTV